MEHITIAAALNEVGSLPHNEAPHPHATPVAAVAAFSVRLRGEGKDDGPVTVSVDTSSASSHSLHNLECQRRVHADSGATAARPVVIPPPPGVTGAGGNAANLPSSSLPRNRGDDSDGSDVASATQHLTAADQAATTTASAVRLSSSPVDVPPSAVPASRYSNIYDGRFHLPPGMTKRALGRLRLVWCCVLTQESWHASFVAGPILFFVILFVTLVVPPKEWFSYLITFVLTVGSLTCLTLSVTLDPGVIPPAPLSEQPSGPATVVVDGKPVECKVCKTCHILRPPRSSHCKFCDVCVADYDHHCGVLGSCVAKRTFRFFGGFFIITTILALYVGIRSFAVVVSTDFSQGNEDMHLLGVAAGSVACIVGAIVGGMMVLPCAGRYVVLSATNETTKETMRREQQAESGELPGCVPVEEVRGGDYCKHFARRLFGPLGRSRIPFDYYV
ncbi:hypothetical protein ABB37_00472 [Leptomonas pyrrhocoris]|uniref:Palmitoyltransferase n=1 Tax=Leptomonas pyrrhocoris TaxID=157538 RepID=A0A0M9GAM2_LEPPY|nr:hypothetical protein ABB37_00472 [Leptomonas pyrrhocoris]KPA86239.1 hypothetical protein ABB37_00472 [Leptomonas pyrrhocoris]|eukprot:XP_015664678.1 hypothetical protein ABB37_00472 [Leptomonas pyrrhocoris]